MASRPAATQAAVPPPAKIMSTVWGMGSCIFLFFENEEGLGRGIGCRGVEVYWYGVWVMGEGLVGVRMEDVYLYICVCI